MYSCAIHQLMNLYHWDMNKGLAELCGVLVSAGVELIFFLVAGTVLCFGFSVRIMLIMC